MVMEESYRIRKVTIDINAPLTDELPNPYREPCLVTRYIVQVRGFLWWNTVKAFKKIRPAVRLYHYLRDKDNED